MKTNKSYTKRLKRTKSGKLMARAVGQNHYNAKEGGESALKRKRMKTFDLSSKARSRFLGSS